MISVITPNYNAETYLSECLDSVAGQTIDPGRVEMIVVDDGSTDESRGIIEGYTSQIPGLQTIWHEHTGKPGALRNIGIARAVGEYALFLDSDDFLAPQALERMHDFVDEGESDVIAFQLAGLNRDVSSAQFTHDIRDADLIASGVYDTLGTWKMYRRLFLNVCGISFPDERGRGEDVIFCTEALLRAKRVSVLGDYPYYTLRRRDDGTSITQTGWAASDRLDVAASMAKKIIKWAPSIEVVDWFMVRAFHYDALPMINSPNTTGTERQRIKDELGPHWTPAVARLIKDDEHRGTLNGFFNTEFGAETHMDRL
jgi:glycosyltransferase involved in cell wall biosynthesis